MAGKGVEVWDWLGEKAAGRDWEMGEGEGSASQAKAVMVRNMDNSASRNGHPVIHDKVVLGI